ncbi:MAG: lipid-A-disaccharide synthase [Acidobacteria bacterium]|nr:lipid-A-disaccharide synthase [Acidobacteriota bacterium]
MLACGEPSGDLYAGALAREIRALEPDVRVYGLGAAGLEAGGAERVADYRGLTVTGLSEALSVLPRSLAVYRRLVRMARAERPDVFVPIDFPDFNFRLAGALHRLGVPVVYYVCPQLWAWRRGRLRTMRRFVRRALVIFPFEAAIYRDAGIPVEFVGHPLVELCRPRETRAVFLQAAGLDPAAPTVALLPGSRPNEVRAILPEIVRAAPLIRRQVPRAQFLVARAPHLDDDLFSPLTELSAAGLPLAVAASRTDDVLAASDVAVTASGTATVQAALHGLPLVIVYRLSPLTYRLVRTFAHVDTVGMVNLIAGRRIVPELVQDALTAEAVRDEIVRFLTDTEAADRARQALAAVREQLGHAGASGRAAAAVLAVARAQRASAAT